MPTLKVLVGMVASGKSTYARWRADEGALVISHDDLTEMLHACYRYEADLRECYRRMEEALAAEAIRAGRDLVIDRTHLTRESRKRWLDFAIRHAAATGELVGVVAVAFPIEPPLLHASRRFQADSRGRTLSEWYTVAEHHFAQAQAEPLSADEGFAEIRRVTPTPERSPL